MRHLCASQPGGTPACCPAVGRVRTVARLLPKPQWIFARTLPTYSSSWCALLTIVSALRSKCSFNFRSLVAVFSVQMSCVNYCGMWKVLCCALLYQMCAIVFFMAGLCSPWARREHQTVSRVSSADVLPTFMANSLWPQILIVMAFVICFPNVHDNIGVIASNYTKREWFLDKEPLSVAV